MVGSIKCWERGQQKKGTRYEWTSSEKITPFGGFNYCFERFHQSGLAGLIDRHFGPRVKTAGLSCSEIMAKQLRIFLTGGDCSEDLNEHHRGPLGQVRGMAVCSADTMLRAIKELSCACQRDGIR